jgi:hypothetical protein
VPAARAANDAPPDDAYASTPAVPLGVFAQAGTVGAGTWPAISALEKDSPLERARLDAACPSTEPLASDCATLGSGPPCASAVALESCDTGLVAPAAVPISPLPSGVTGLAAALLLPVKL